MRTTATLLPAALVVGAVLIADRADACTCAIPPPEMQLTEEERVESKLEASEEIFQGRVVARRSAFDAWCDREEEQPPDEHWALVEVSRVWRGEVGEKVLLTTVFGSCMSLPDVGEEWLFAFGPREPGAPRFTAYCARYSFPVEVATERADLLGEPYEPTREVEALPPLCPSEPPADEGCAATSPSSTALAALLLGLLALGRRRRRR